MCVWISGGQNSDLSSKTYGGLFSCRRQMFKCGNMKVSRPPFMQLSHNLEELVIQ